MKQILKKIGLCGGAILLWLWSVGQPNITKVEYYIDVDPGYGFATLVSVTPGTNIASQTINLDPTSLTQGIHLMGLRAQDANGSWSLNQKLLFIKPYTTGNTISGAVPNITNVEYYIDADPGYGKATTVSITPGTDLGNQLINLDPTSLGQGIHVLGLRAQDANGSWSLNQKLLFIKPYNTSISTSGPVPNIANVEYYIDADPGYGKATAVSITPSTDLGNQIINIDPSTLTQGIHIMGLRAQDANGSWSLGQKWLFIKPYTSSLTTPATKTISQAEYYFDADPGFGKAFPIAIQNINNLNAIQLSTNVTGLATGSHKLYIRAKDNVGAWGFSDTLKFTVPSAIATPAIEVSSISKITAFCAQDSVYIGYQSTGTYNSGNIFTAYISDANGSFASKQAIGSATSTASGLIGCRLTSHLPDGTGYKIRVESSNTVVVGDASAYTLTIHDRPNAQTIIGDANVNAGYLYPYSLPAVATSSWVWVAPAASIAQTANTANLTWNTVGQLQPLKIIETNQYGCIGDTSTLAVNVYPLQITTVAPASLTPCPASSFAVLAAASGVYYPGNIFTAQLSDASGSFASATNIGTLAPSTQPLGNNQPISINCTLPFPLANGSGYLVRILGSNYAVTSSNSATITVQKPNLGADVQTTISCANGTANLTTLYNTVSYATVVYNTLTPTAVGPGNYTLIVTNANGCKDTANITVNNASIVPVATNGALLLTADRECSDANGWTHYYSNNGTPTDFSDDIRLLSVQKNGQNIGTVGDGTFQVNVAATAGAGSNSAVVVSSPIVTNQLYGMNRYWNITPTTEPASPVGVRFYYNTQDLNDVNGSVPTAPKIQTQLIVYKTVGGNPDPTSNFAGATAVNSYLNGTVPSTNTWVYTSLGNNMHQAEFLVGSFSGGGMGATTNDKQLPVTLLSFNAQKEANDVKLVWSTATEINSKQFLVQRSTDGVNFTNIGMVAAAGNSTMEKDYVYADPLTSIIGTPPVVYYRLLMQDLDGTSTFSPIRSIGLGENSNLLSLQYNPVKNVAVLNYQSATTSSVVFKVLDMAGKTMMVQTTDVAAGTNQIQLNTTALAKGMYMVQAIGSSSLQMVRMMKQ